MDLVQSWIYSFPDCDSEVEVLHVIPVTRELRPLLLVAFNKNKNKKKDSGFRISWELTEPVASNSFDIVLKSVGEQFPGKGGVRATYRWSRELSELQGFVGPQGGYDESFMRVDGISREDIKRFGASVR